jgi:hypothetical protein
MALAMACGPQAGLFPDRSSYAPGDSGTITGVNFTPDLSFTIDVENGPTLASVTVPTSGTFSVAFTAPSAPGAYVIVANGIAANGTRLTSSPGTLVVAAPVQAPAPTSDSAPAAAPADASAPATAAQPAPAAAAPATPARASARRASTRPAVTRSPDRRHSSTSPRPVVVPPAVVPSPTQPATAVFAGSVARHSSAATAPHRRTAATARHKTAPASRSKAAVPSQNSIVSDAWSGLDKSSPPALVADGTSSPSPSPSNATATTLSILMLGLGLAGLVGSLGVGELRRRRSRAR